MSDERKSILMRAYLIYVLVVVFAIIILGRILQIQLVEGEYWKKQANTRNVMTEVIEPTRGNIYSENGSLLATSIPIFQVNIDLDPKAIPDTMFNKHIDSLGICLSLFFDNTVNNKNKYINELKEARKKHDRNHLLVRKATYVELKKIKKFPILRKGKYGGLIVTKNFKRIRPFKNLASMTIGYERLSEYVVKINLNKRKVEEQKFLKYLDTLSQCFANTFNDYNREYYKKILLKAYKGKDSDAITKRIDELQLEELIKFPIIEEKISANTDIMDLVDSLSKGKNESVKLGVLDIKKLTNSYYVGLEGQYREILRGKKGFISKKRVGTNSWIEVSDDDIIKPKNGYDLYTSIDVNLQDVAQSALRKSMDTTHADWGCVILMEVQTGYIKAIANLTKNKDGTYSELRNYAYRQQYEPGSTLKLASVIAVLEDGEYDTNCIVRSGRVKYPDYDKEIVDSHKEGYGMISVAKAFEKSSNVGITQITRMAFRGPTKKVDVIIKGKKKRIDVDPQLEKFKKLIAKMGLLKKTGIDLYNETSPYFPIDKSDLTAIAFGYSVRLTPLQVLSLYNAVANNGRYMKPKIVKEIMSNGVLVYKNNPEVLINQICSEGTLKKIKSLLEGVVERGTAHNISKAPYKIAGKTGTARIWDEVINNYVDSYIASFCGYFPADDPKYSCIVVEYNMKGGEVYGSQVAAPVFKEIADKVYATRVDIKTKENKMPEKFSKPVVSIGFRENVESVYNGLNYKLLYSGSGSEWVSVVKDSNRLYEKDKVFSSQKIPDVKGMTAKDAVFMLEKTGIEVIVNGTGRVIEQKINTEKRIVELTLSL